MVKNSKFTEKIGSENFTNTFCQITNKFQKSEGGGGGGGLLQHPPPHTHNPARHTPFQPLVRKKWNKYFKLRKVL